MDNSGRFVFRWEQFQRNVQDTFSGLRNVTDFTDVTLVSDDGKEIEAHKVIISASCDFFNSIFRKNKHSNPYVYLYGISAKLLSGILDFIYYGEVTVVSEDLNNFLTLAKNFKIKGLEETKGEEVVLTKDTFSDKQCEKIAVEEKVTIQSDNDPGHKDIEEENYRDVQNLIEEKVDKFQCKCCGQLSKNKGNMMKHVKIHLLPKICSTLV